MAEQPDITLAELKDRPDVAAARKALQKQQPRLDPKRLVLIDETSVSTRLPPSEASRERWGRHGCSFGGL